MQPQQFEPSETAVGVSDRSRLRQMIVPSLACRITSVRKALKTLDIPATVPNGAARRWNELATPHLEGRTGFIPASELPFPEFRN